MQFNQHKGFFDNISKNDVAIDDHNFGKKISKFFIRIEPKIKQILEDVREVKQTFKEDAEYFMLKDEEMRTKSELYFGFFQTVINNVQKSMPKVEEDKEEKLKKAKTLKDRRKARE